MQESHLKVLTNNKVNSDINNEVNDINKEQTMKLTMKTNDPLYIAIRVFSKSY